MAPLSRRKFIYSSTLAIVGFSHHQDFAAQGKKCRHLFDGKSLAGWHAAPRLMIGEKDGRFDGLSSEQLGLAVSEAIRKRPGGVRSLENKGVWEVKDGAIVGGQVPGTQAGAYLISNEVFGDFELSLEARPDFPCDTGIMIRAHALGGVGFQVLLDHRKSGAIGGFYGNGVGGFRAYPFVIDGDEQAGFKVANLRAGTAVAAFFRPDFAASLEDFLKVWRPNDWNTFRVRCTGRLPLIETWINGTPIAKLDTAKLADRVPGYDPEVIFQRIGRKGHIALEVHDNGPMGRNRWAPGAVCRWRNIQITEL